MTGIDDTIWRHLVDHHDAHTAQLPAEHPQRHRSTIAAGATAVATAAAAATVLLTIPTAQPAYALSRHSDGSVTVTIHDVAHAISSLNAKFAELGIKETVVPVRSNCSTPHQSLMNDPMFAYAGASPQTTLTFGPGRKHLAPGYTGVIAAEQLANGRVALAVEAVKPPVPTCFPTTIYTITPAGTTTNGTPFMKVTPTTETPATPTGG